MMTRMSDWEREVSKAIILHKASLRYLMSGTFLDFSNIINNLKVRAYLYGDDTRRCFCRGQYWFSVIFKDGKWACTFENDFDGMSEKEYIQKYPDIWKLIIV